MNGKQLKNSILQWAIQGKLVPQDPKDEPASALLERIRAEKARLVKEGKLKKDKNESIIFRGDDNSHYEKFLATGEVKCIEEEIPFEIPAGWEWTKIRNISRSYIGLTYSPSDVSSQGTIVLRSSNIQNGKIVLNDVVRVTKEISEKLHVEKNDIIICARNGSAKLVGKSAIVKAVTEPMTFGAFMAICKTALYQYVSLFLQSNLFFYQLRGVSGTTTINQLTQNSFNDFLIPIPPFAEQSRIISKIEELCPLIERYGKSQDSLDILNAEIKELLNKSILQEAIQGRLVPQIAEEGTAGDLLAQIKAEKLKLVKEGKLKKSALTDSVIFKDDDNRHYEQVGADATCIEDEIPFEIPDSWSWVRLRDLCSIITGATFKKEDVTQCKNGVRVLRGGNIFPFEIKFKQDDIFLDASQVKTDILLKQNDLITPAVTSLENICKMARVVRDMESTTVGGFVFILRLYRSNDTLSRWLLSVLSSPSLIEFVKSITNKSGQAFYNIGKERLGTTMIPLPPHKEQECIVQRINEVFSKL